MKTLGRIAFAATFLALSTGIAAVACGGGNDNLPPPPPPPPPPPATPDAAAPVATSPPPANPPTPPPRPPVTLTAGAASPDPSPPPTVKLTAPTRDQVIAGDKAGGFEVKLDVKNWQTAPGSQHVHLILDNRPYKPIYDTKAPVRLNELAGGEELKEGRHVLVAFPSRANHESVKTKDALTAIEFWVGKKGDTKDDPTKKPMLIYSRPKGDYNGDMANHVLVDFQLANDTLAEGKDHVNVTVTGPGLDSPLTSKVTKFGAPLYLDNLQNGSYTLKLELVDGSDKAIDGPWNATTRTIKVDHDAPMDANMGHGPAAPAGGADAGASKGAPPAPASTPATMGTAPYTPH